ncbi:hypothetical protein BS50DRAFT_342147 [Corynespora cassiicola Philippines]|uniref:Uncharacterized protein n=1 Tax=Corynespora cassiicola Philippines TaxID=1448308 RepID=A0A2T2NVN2_CORCC|nr:hypothetical protein BS50DRAFT_342147 [Corynespora cassiicola Philippines]
MFYHLSLLHSTNLIVLCKYTNSPTKTAWRLRAYNKTDGRCYRVAFGFGLSRITALRFCFLDFSFVLLFLLLTLLILSRLDLGFFPPHHSSLILSKIPHSERARTAPSRLVWKAAITNDIHFSGRPTDRKRSTWPIFFPFSFSFIWFLLAKQFECFPDWNESNPNQTWQLFLPRCIVPGDDDLETCESKAGYSQLGSPVCSLTRRRRRPTRRNEQGAGSVVCECECVCFARPIRHPPSARSSTCTFVHQDVHTQASWAITRRVELSRAQILGGPYSRGGAQREAQHSTAQRSTAQHSKGKANDELVNLVSRTLLGLCCERTGVLSGGRRGV